MPVRSNCERGIGHDAATADLAAAGAGILDAAVVAPFAGVVHVGLALLEQLAVAGKRIEPLRADHVDIGVLLHVLLAVGPLDDQPLFLEQSFVVGHQLRQSLKRRGRFQNQLLHGSTLPHAATMDAATTGPTRTSQPTGTPQRNDSSAVFGAHVLNEFAGCNSRNFKTTAPAEISVTGCVFLRGPVPPRGRTTAPGGRECVGMSAHAWAIRIA